MAVGDQVQLEDIGICEEVQLVQLVDPVRPAALA